MPRIYLSLRVTNIGMKTPLCSACLNSEFLCNGCNTKIENGELTKKAVEIIRYMHELSEQFAALRDVTVKDILSYPEATILIVRPEDVARVIGKKGRTISQIASYAQKPVKVVSNTSIQDTAQSLVHPAEVKRVSTVFFPESTKKRITITAADADKIQLPLRIVNKVIADIYAEDVEITYQ